MLCVYFCKRTVMAIHEKSMNINMCQSGQILSNIGGWGAVTKFRGGGSDRLVVVYGFYNHSYIHVYIYSYNHVYNYSYIPSDNHGYYHIHIYKCSGIQSCNTMIPRVCENIWSWEVFDFARIIFYKCLYNCHNPNSTSTLLKVGCDTKITLIHPHHPPPPPPTQTQCQQLLTCFWWNFKGRILGTSRTDSNCHGDIYSGNIWHLSWQQLFWGHLHISGISQLLLTQYQPSGTVGTRSPPAMPYHLQKPKWPLRGPQNGWWGLEWCLALGFWALPSTFAK